MLRILVSLELPLLTEFHEVLALNINTVRYGGKILYVGTLSNETVVDPKICIKKRLTVLFNYGGQYSDVVEVLDLISKGIIRPQVENGKLEDFPKVLKDLHEGKIKSRMALIPSHSR
jgi:propanol-preferring alcohol dehydrogenase